MKCSALALLPLHVLFGQLVALVNSFTGVSTTKLIINEASYPILQSLTAYSFIFTVYGPIFILIYHRHKHEKFRNFSFLWRPWKYIFLGLVDSQANFVIVKAFQYTDLVSAQLLTCFSIPCVLVLSYFILKTRYTFTHIAGCVIALGGLLLLVLLDADGVSRTESGPNVVKGDLLGIVAATLYAVSNVLTEYFIKPKAMRPQADLSSEHTAHQDEVMERPVASRDDDSSASVLCDNASDNARAHENEGRNVPALFPMIENVCCMSGFAVIITVIQFFALEWSTFSSRTRPWTSEDWIYQMLFGFTMLLVYTGIPALFLFKSATFANISLLATSVYGIIWNVTIFHVYPTPIFFAAFLLIITGVLIYAFSDLHWSWCPEKNYPCGVRAAVEGGVEAER
ncbi:unnamed protein product [Trypanosoma congolense IL3000]|uniref:WGS project CAEQ00000000 data, annotated contig 1039 n=1 Tax=Trypanosoma congolense (strain IL3000) TaxID=1068625 RepID=F9W3D3_TRYCI|nr:unnamed protein product [Trypanosoma congolense IL3000]